MKINRTCTAVLTKEGGWYVARCLELGVISQGRTIEEAQENLREALELYLEGEPEAEKLFSPFSPLITALQVPTD